jgi:hypothetical protein
MERQKDLRRWSAGREHTAANLSRAYVAPKASQAAASSAGAPRGRAARERVVRRHRDQT